MQAPLEICYAGVVIARAEEVREDAGGEFFVVMKDPLPVGTLLGVRSADSMVSVRVLRVVESADSTTSGMQVRLATSEEASAVRWIPPPPVARLGSTLATAATHAAAAIEPPASPEPTPVQAAPASAAESASESPAVAPTEERAPAGGLPTEAVDFGVPAAAGSNAAPVAQAAVVEPVAPDRATDSTAVPQAVPVAVGSSLTGALERVVAGESEAVSGAVETSGEVSAPGDAVPPVEGDLPPARPVQGSGGRRRTKRRR